MQWMRRLLMDTHQRRLTDPSAYDAPVDRQAVLAELDAGAAGHRCHETNQFMRRAATDIADKGDLTIRKVADAYDKSRRMVRQGFDPAYGDFPQLTLCGDHALLEYLIGRANDLAAGIQPGAKDALGSAFRG